MTANFFVENLNKLKPSKTDLLNITLDENFANSILESYECTKRTYSIKESKNSDTILVLLNDFDCSKIEIGTIHLIERPAEYTNFYKIGNVDLDILALDKISHEIILLDQYNTKHVIFKCAANSNFFLKALLLCSEYFAYKIKNYPIEDDQSTILKYVESSSSAAGGVKFIDFYKMLLGYYQ